MKMFDHPNIVKYYEHFMQDKNIYIVMEYCDKHDLQWLIEQKQKNNGFTENELLFYFTQLVMGLKHIHDNNVLHRDIKGENIFLSSRCKDKSKYALKYGDFGLSKVLQKGVNIAKTFAGSPLFMAPEVLRCEQYDKKADIWSLGALLYKMCTFHTIVEANFMKSLIAKIQKA